MDNEDTEVDWWIYHGKQLDWEKHFETRDTQSIQMTEYKFERILQTLFSHDTNSPITNIIKQFKSPIIEISEEGMKYCALAYMFPEDAKTI